MEALFRYSAVGLLLVTAAAKLVSASGNAPLLDYPDPLFGLPNRHLMLWVGWVELAVAAALVAPMDRRRQHLLVAWLSTTFLTYRTGLLLLHPDKPCACLGTLTEKLHFSQATISILLWSAVLYLLSGSLAYLLSQVRRPSHRLDRPC